jgi:uncharacterized protein YdeI (YjbR/CyaY-like superfamily)
MNIGKTLYVTNAKEWRSWLAKNSKKEKEIWLIYYKKASGKPRIQYNDAVDEALCFGWIDSTVKSMDAERFAQRFTPRRKASNLSGMNRERMHRLVAAKRMTSAGLKAVTHTFSDKEKEKFNIASDIIRALRKNQDAWANFRKFPESYLRMRIAYIETQRRQSREAFQISLANFIKMTERNKKFGMVR